jgi:hypothetical protein
MQARGYLRATEPDMNAIADAIRAHMIAATGNDTFCVSWAGGNVILSAPNLTNVNDATVQAAVDAAPAPSNKLTVKRWVDEMPLPEKAIPLTIIDGVNTIRGKLVPPLNAITPAQFLSAIKAKADEIVVDRPEKPKEKDKA